MMCEKLRKKEKQKLLNGSISLPSERWSTSTLDSGQRPTRKVRNVQNVRLMQFIREKHMKTSLDSVRKDLTQDVSLVFLSPAFLLLEGIRSCLWQTLRVTWLSENNWTRVEAWHSSNFKIPEKIALPSLHSYLCIGSNEIYHVHI